MMGMRKEGYSSRAKLRGPVRQSDRAYLTTYVSEVENLG